MDAPSFFSITLEASRFQKENSPQLELSVPVIMVCARVRIQRSLKFNLIASSEFRSVEARGGDFEDGDVVDVEVQARLVLDADFRIADERLALGADAGAHWTGR